MAPDLARLWWRRPGPVLNYTCKAADGASAPSAKSSSGRPKSAHIRLVCCEIRDRPKLFTVESKQLLIAPNRRRRERCDAGYLDR
jgi:hypothetical protein